MTELPTLDTSPQRSSSASAFHSSPCARRYLEGEATRPLGERTGRPEFKSQFRFPCWTVSFLSMFSGPLYLLCLSQGVQWGLRGDFSRREEVPFWSLEAAWGCRRAGALEAQDTGPELLLKALPQDASSRSSVQVSTLLGHIDRAVPRRERANLLSTLGGSLSPACK